MDLYMLLLLSVCAASLNNTLLHKAALSDKKQIYCFNLGCSAVWIILLFVANKCTFHMDKEVLLWGLAYGIMQMLFFVFKTGAMTTGPVSVTTLIGNCSMLVSILLSAILWKEPIGVQQCIGIVLLLIAVFLCTDTKTDSSLSRRWVVYCIGFFLVAGVLGIVIKLFSKSWAGEKRPGDTMIVVAAVMMIVLSVLLVKEQWKTKQRSNGSRLKRCHTSLMIACGILSCGYSRLNVRLTKRLPGAFFFSAFNGGVIIVAALLSVVLLKEKMTVKKSFGLVIGCLAIVVLGL